MDGGGPYPMGAGGGGRFEPLPPLTDPRVILGRTLAALRPAEQISVTEAAAQHVRVNAAGDWRAFDPEVVPYLSEPTDLIASRQFKGLVMCAPSQSGKTQMLINAIGYIITANPGRVALFQMTRDAAQEFERNKLAPTIRNSPALMAKRGQHKGADNLYQKLFAGGTQLSLNWPTITQLSSATIQTVLMTDYDHFPESIGGEGDAYTLGRARVRTFRSRGMVVVESSPGAPITDEAWQPRSPHDSPPVAYGVLALYPEGTRGRWYWPCPNCGDEFEPTFDRLIYPDSGDPLERGQAAEMACPHCGGLFGHGLKRELNRAGRWLHEARDGSLVPITSGDLRQTDMASYWLNGAAAAFSTWADLVAQHENARTALAATGDEEKLRAAANTGQGVPFVPTTGTGSELSLPGLRHRAAGITTAKGVCPWWTRYILLSMDTQGNRFEAQVTAFDETGRHQIVDRFALTDPPEGTDSSRGLLPMEVAAHWDVLRPLTYTVWPVEGAGYGLRPRAIGIDMQGGQSTTENAYRFYRALREDGQAKDWYLTRGSGGRHTDRVWLKTPERGHNGKRAASDITILNMATDRLKDSVTSSLHAPIEAANACLPGAWMSDQHLLEFTAERRTDKGWEKRPGMARNESLDLTVSARALNIIIGGERLRGSYLPAWCRVGGSNPYMADLVADTPATGPVETKAPPRPTRRRSGGMRI